MCRRLQPASAFRLGIDPQTTYRLILNIVPHVKRGLEFREDFIFERKDSEAFARIKSTRRATIVSSLRRAGENQKSLDKK